MGWRRTIAGLAFLALLQACANTVEMKYSGGAGAPQGAGGPAVALGDVQDKRPHKPTYLGSILSGFGSPLKTLETPVPVSQVVRDGFSNALQARNMLAQSAVGSFVLSVTINKFDCSQYASRDMHVEFAVTLTNRSTGAQLYSDVIAIEESELALLEGGIFGSPDALRAVAARGMQKAIDATLDNPRMRQALGQT